MFTARKIAQMSAFFAERQGGTINILKLVKLLYLSDRESMTRHGIPISFDYAYAMDNGPMLSQALDFINGIIPDKSDMAKWEEWFSSRTENHQIKLIRDFGRDDLDEISEADLGVLEAVWKSFGHMDQWELVDYTHNNCSEYKKPPKGSRNAINDAEILEAVGVPKEHATELSEEIQAQRRLDAIFSN